MQWRNTKESFGLVNIVLHWVVALAVFGLFGLGVWMVELGYYDPWYQRAPALHLSIGLLLFVLLLLRVLWRLSGPMPRALDTHSPLERIAAVSVHLLLYLLLFAVVATGYLIASAGGEPIPVFDLFRVPALPGLIDDQEDVAGYIHAWLAWGLVVLAALHALASLKHHFIDRDTSLVRMLGGARNLSDPSTKERRA